jgi:predicted TIM-barrel fold metal-dependent hydrolase
MIIDWHTHVHPPREADEPRWRGNCPATIENVLALHEQVGLDISVISSAGHYLKNFSRAEALPVLRESNDHMAAMRDKHKDKILTFATAIPGGGNEHLKELERGETGRSARRAHQFEPPRGGICEIIGRMDYAYELRDDPLILGPYEPLRITRKPSDYLRMMYFDTVSYHGPAVECAIKTVGADRLIFGTDSPMLVALKQRGLDLITGLGLGARERDLILAGTARKLLKLGS